MRDREKRNLNRMHVLLLVPVFIVMLASYSYSASVEDSFIKGYAASILEREFDTSPVFLSVKDGVVYLSSEEISGVDRGKLISVLLKIKGVERVEIMDSGQAKPDSAAVYLGDGKAREGVNPERDDSGKKSFFQEERLFDPLLADPRWPNFSGAYHYYIDNDELQKVFAASVGDIIPMYTDDVPFAFGGKWQAGGEASAFVIHDLATPSWDQVNADYWFGIMMAYRKDSLSGLFRIFHQSSHIGDEYLLHNSVKRENYSYEASGLLVSKYIRRWLRIYGGGEYRFSRSPKDLKAWALQYGLELESPATYLQGTFRPVAAADVKHKEDNDWSGEVSVKAGVLVENNMLIRHKFRLMLGYFNGHSPNGQFYKQSEQVTSIGFYYNY